MARKKCSYIVKEDELDWHEPLYDRKDFRRYALETVLPVVGVRFAARRRVKLRLGKKVVPHWIDHAFGFLELHGKIQTEVRGQAITYIRLATYVPVPAPLPNLNENWFFGSRALN